jgi:hypothetical protein
LTVKKEGGRGRGERKRLRWHNNDDEVRSDARRQISVDDAPRVG